MAVVAVVMWPWASTTTLATTTSVGSGETSASTYTDAWWPPPLRDTEDLKRVVNWLRLGCSFMAGASTGEMLSSDEGIT